MSVPKEKISAALKTLNSTQDSIKGASKLIKPHSGQAHDIARIFHEEVNKAPPSTKLLIIYVMHEIMMETKDRNFVVAFGDVSKAMFGDIAESLSDKGILGKCQKIFSVWEKEFLFKKEFVQKLSAIIQNKIDILDGVKPQETIPESKQDVSPSNKNYTKAFIRDYNNVKENSLAKAYYDRKAQESNYSKYEEKIMEISEMVKDIEKNHGDPDCREKLREALQFLRTAQEQYQKLLLDTTDYMCNLSKKIESDTKKWISTNYEKYESYEKQIQRRKELLE